MTKFKDFGTPEINTSESVSFRLYGEEFACRPQIPGKVMLDLATKGADDSNPAANAAIIDEFFSYVLVPESHARFSALCLDPDRVVTMEQLMEVVTWLMETYADRPTTRPEDSAPGQ